MIMYTLIEEEVDYDMIGQTAHQQVTTDHPQQ